MSTILDALRKVEGERRVSDPSPREWLLFFSQVAPLPSFSRKGVWVAGLVLMGVGFASGVGVALLHSVPTVLVPAEQPAAIALREQPSAQSAFSSSELPAAMAAARDAPVPQFPPEDLHESSLTDPPFLAAVRRSPFDASKEPYESERQPYEQPQGTLNPQVPSPSSSPLAQTRSLRSLTDAPLSSGLRSDPLGSASLTDAPLSSSLGISNRDNKSNSGRQPFPQPQRQREPLKVSLNLLQWSPEVEKRRAVISVNSGPMLTVHEGDTVSNLTVEHIRPNAVELRFDDSTTVELRLGDPNFVVKPRPGSSSPAPLAP